MKKYLALVLALLMLLSALVACKGNEESPKGTDAKTSENTTVDDVDGTNYLEMLPKENLDRDFTILCSNTKGDQYVTEAQVDGGDVVSSAVWKRNLMVEDYKGVRIVLDAQDDRWALGDIPYVTMLRANDMANDCPYNAIALEQTYASSVAAEGLLYNLNAIESFEYDQPWWYSSFSENNTVYGNLYMLAGDISHMVLGTAWTVIYNKQISERIGITNFYELVSEKAWTFENMMVAAKAAATDEGEASTYGLGLNRHALRSSPLSFAIPVCSRTEEGGYELTMYSDRTERIYSDIYNAIYSSDNAIFGDFESDGQAQRTLIPKFAENKLLFMMFSLEFLGDFKDSLDKTTDYGILPYPMYDEAQGEYRTSVGNLGVYVGIPKKEADPAFSGNILNALGAAGKTYVYPAYYETTLKLRTAKDKESFEMLNIIRDSMYFTFASVHASALDNITSRWGDTLLPKEGVASESFRTTYTSVEKNSGAALKKALEQYAKIGE